jgi:hypothetical protein
LLRHVV